jgi:integrase
MMAQNGPFEQRHTPLHLLTAQNTAKSFPLCRIKINDLTFLSCLEPLKRAKMGGMKTTAKRSTRWSAAKIHFLTQDEMRRLLSVIDSKRDYAIFLTAYRHGLRASEVGLIHLADFDLKQYRLRIQRLKSSLAGLHPLQPDEVKAVKAYLKERDSRIPALFLSRNNAPISRRRLDELMKH